MAEDVMGRTLAEALIGQERWSNPEMKGDREETPRGRLEREKRSGVERELRFGKRDLGKIGRTRK